MSSNSLNSSSNTDSTFVQGSISSNNLTGSLTYPYGSATITTSDFKNYSYADTMRMNGVKINTFKGTETEITGSVDVFLEECGKPLCYKTDGDAGADICSAEDVVIPPGERRVIKTGVHIKMPKGMEAQVRDRSGLAAKYGITVLAGTIDSGYIGEIKVVLLNTDKENEFKIEKGDRIAQLVFSIFCKADFNLTEILEDTERGSGGFGSTGVK